MEEPVLISITATKTSQSTLHFLGSLAIQPARLKPNVWSEVQKIVLIICSCGFLDVFLSNPLMWSESLWRGGSSFSVFNTFITALVDRLWYMAMYTALTVFEAHLLKRMHPTQSCSHSYNVQLLLRQFQRGVDSTVWSCWSLQFRLLLDCIALWCFSSNSRINKHVCSLLA